MMTIIKHFTHCIHLTASTRPTAEPLKPLSRPRPPWWPPTWTTVARTPKGSNIFNIRPQAIPNRWKITRNIRYTCFWRQISKCLPMWIGVTWKSTWTTKILKWSSTRLETTFMLCHFGAETISNEGLGCSKKRRLRKKRVPLFLNWKKKWWGFYHKTRLERKKKQSFFKRHLLPFICFLVWYFYVLLF